MKKVVALIMTLTVVFSAVGCGSNKESLSISGNNGNDESSGNYYYETEDLTQTHGGVAMARVDNETVAVIDNMSEKITLLKGEESKSFKTGISEELQRFGVSDRKELLINTFGDNENKIYKLDLDGNLLEEIICPELLSPVYEGKKYKSEDPFISIIGDKLIFKNNSGYQVYDLITSEISPIVNGYLDAVKIIDGKVLGILIDQKPMIVEVDLTSKETTIMMELKDEAFYKCFTSTDEGYLGIGFEGNLEYINISSNEVIKESLKELGDTRFLRQLFYNNVEKIGDDLYLSTIEMKQGDEAPIFINSILKLTKKDGVNPSKANLKNIVIYGKNRDYLLEMASKNYMGSHNDVVIDIKTFDDLSTDDYIKLVNTNVLSGEQVDMIYFDELPVTKLINKGFFEPLDNHITDEEMANIDPNILQSLKYNGSIYGFPRTVKFYSLYASDAISKDSIADYKNSEYSFDGYFNLMSSISKTNAKALRSIDKATLFDIYLGNNIQAIIDVNNKSFNIEKFTQLVDLVENSCDDKNMDKNMDWDSFVYYGTKGNIGFEPIQDGDVGRYQYFKMMYGSNYNLLPLPSYNGGYTINVNPMGVLASSSMKEDAIDFLKYSTLNESSMENLVQFDQLPLSSKIIREYMESNKNEGAGSLMYSEATKYGDKAIEINVPYNSEYAMIIDQYKNAKGSNAFHKDILNLLSKEAKSYFESEEDKENFVSNVQNKINLYLNE